MSEILWLIAIALILVYHWWYVRETGIKEQKYIKAILSKNLPELVEAELATKPHKEEPPQDELVPSEEMDETLFDKVIQNQLKEK